MKFIIFALIIALIVVTALLFEYKLAVKVLTTWMIEKNCPAPKKEDIKRMGKIIADKKFKR